MLEKLKKNDVDFIAAFLGSSKNKQDFINSQKPIKQNIVLWRLSEQEIIEIKSKLNELGNELDTMLKRKNWLSELRETLSAIETEKKYFDVYYLESSDNDVNLKTKYHLDSDGMLRLWNEFEYLIEVN